MPEPLIEIVKGHKWRNWHDTSGVGGKVEQLLTPRNEWIDGTPNDPKKRWLPGLSGLQKIVRAAETNEKRVRALGSGCALSPVAFVDEYLINTARLSDWSVG